MGTLTMYPAVQQLKIETIRMHGLNMMATIPEGQSPARSCCLMDGLQLMRLCFWETIIPTNLLWTWARYHYYTTYADEGGNFTFDNVRSALQA
jgi:hypothetical protein